MQPTYYNRTKLRGGRYQSLYCYGHNTLLGSLKAESVRLRGDIFSEYDLRILNLNATGSIHAPELRCETAVWYGNSGARCAMKVSKYISIYGNFIGEGSIISPAVRLDGNITYSGRITARELFAQGELALGPVDSADVRIEFANRSRIASIKGKRVIISRRPLSLMSRLFMAAEASKNSFCSVTDGIRGEMINIEHVVADTVSGYDVIIGPGCRINKVYYRDHIYIDEAAYVGWYEPLPDEPLPDEPKGPEQP